MHKKFCKMQLSYCQSPEKTKKIVLNIITTSGGQSGFVIDG